ncbi:NAD(P)-dependent oxidoreductase [Paradesulfitobacterium aromaticivorans]
MKIVFPDADSQYVELLAPELSARLQSLGEFIMYEKMPEEPEEYIRRIGDADAVIQTWKLPDEVFDHCPRLKMINYLGIGAANFINIRRATEEGVIVTNTPGYGNNTVAEHALALLLAVAKHVCQGNAKLREGMFDQSQMSFDLAGKTIGLIGLGGIGERMAAICRALGMNVLCWTRNPSPARAEQSGVKFVELGALLKESDAVSLHLALNEETRGLLREKELSLLKKGSVLINTARAEIVDTAALVKLLRSGHIAGAGIDVFDKEPLPEDSPLLGLENVVMTPHTGFNSPDAVRNILTISISNLEHFAQGKPVNVVRSIQPGWSTINA